MPYYLQIKIRVLSLTLLIIIVFLFVSRPGWSKEYDPRLLQSSKLAYQGNWREAEALIQQYLAENPMDPNGLFVKGVVLEWKMGLDGEKWWEAQRKMLEVYQEANDMAFQLWNRDQENVDRLIDLGNSYMFLGRKYSDNGSWLKAVLTAKKCQKHLEKALKLDPNRVDGLLALGGFHYVADNGPKALGPFKALLGISGTKAQGLAELKKSLTQQHPFFYDTQMVFIQLYYDLEKNYPEALNALSVLEKEFPDNPEFKFRRARIYEKQDPKKGIEEYLKFAQWCETQREKCHTNYSFLAYYDAGRLSMGLKDSAKTKLYLAKALQYDTQVDTQLTAQALFWPGLLEKEEGNSAAALEKFQKAEKVPGISGSLKKQIEGELSELCKTNSAPCS